jgi:hypothetical protein
MEILSAPYILMTCRFHTLPSVTYSNFLIDGQTFTSLANLTVTVRLVNNNIYFNDAKVISPNVLYVICSLPFPIVLRSRDPIDC